MIFRVGEWVFCEFKLQQITRVVNGEVCGVSDGHVACGGNVTDRCMPLTMDIKCISNNYERTYQAIHQKGKTGLNYPAIHNWLVREWVAACAAARAGAARVVLTRSFEILGEFEQAVLNKQDIESGYGFPLFRPR